MTFLASEKNRQAEWKLSSKYLTREAKKPGLYRNRLYPWALPVACAGQNLHQWIREDAIEYFRQNQITWHTSAGVDLPTNHLVSSQVMCVNCMFPFFNDPEGLKELLIPVFPDIDRVLPIESKDQYVAFEFIGSENYLNEEPKLGNKRRRGVGNTSIDFAILLQTSIQKKRLLLGEWKSTESYPRINIRYRSDSTDRLPTYRPLLEARDCPIDTSKLNSLDDLFFEPSYQMTRHILMAHEIKKHHPQIDEVIVLDMRSEHNRAILRNPSPGLPQVGTVYDSMRELLHDPGILLDITTESLFGEYHKTHKGPIAKYLSARYRL